MHLKALVFHSNASDTIVEIIFARGHWSTYCCRLGKRWKSNERPFVDRDTDYKPVSKLTYIISPARGGRINVSTGDVPTSRCSERTWTLYFNRLVSFLSHSLDWYRLRFSRFSPSSFPRLPFLFFLFLFSPSVWHIERNSREYRTTSLCADDTDRWGRLSSN